MSKFCGKCGSPIDEGITNCPNCGAAVEPETNQTTPTSTTTATTSAAETIKTKFTALTADKDKLKKYIIIAVAAILGIILLFNIFGSAFGGYKKPIKNYFDAIEDNDKEEYESVFPEFVADKKDDIKQELKDTIKSIEKEVGDDISISFDVLGKAEIDKDDLKDRENDLEEEYDEKIEITKGYQVALEVTIKGDDEKKTQITVMRVYKVDGDWCILSSYGY